MPRKTSILIFYSQQILADENVIYMSQWVSVLLQNNGVKTVQFKDPSFGLWTASTLNCWCQPEHAFVKLWSSWLRVTQTRRHSRWQEKNETEDAAPQNVGQTLNSKVSGSVSVLHCVHTPSLYLFFWLSGLFQTPTLIYEMNHVKSN